MAMTVADVILIGLTLVLLGVVLRWLLKITVDTGKTLLIVGLILVILQFGFGVGLRALLIRAWEVWQKWRPAPAHLFPTEWGLW